MAEGPPLLDRVLETRRPYAVLVLFCLLLWLPGFFTLPPSDRDESRFAQATRQMLETGNYIEIRNGSVARNQKPIGIYWLQAPFAAAAHAAGLARANPVWPYRLPSLLGGLLGVAATYGLGRRLVGAPAALLGAAMLGGSVLLAVETHIAKTDAALLAATTAAMGLLARAYLAPGGFSARAATLFWMAVGAGILLKGPITPMVAGLAVLALVVADRRAAWVAALRPRWGVPLLIAMVLPWLLAIGLATHGRFFAEALGHDLGGKLAGGEESHGGWPGTHLLLLSLTLFPAAPVVLRALPAVWRGRGDPATRFLIAWGLPSWLVFEAVPTKLPHYTLPLFPALCLLGAAWALDPVRRPAPRWLEMASAALFAVAAAILGGGAALLPEVVRPGWAASDAIGLPALAAAALLGWLVLRALPDPRRALGAGLLALPLLLWSVLGLELPDLRGLWLAPQVAAALQAHWPGGRPDDAAFAEIGYAEPSLVFLCGTATGLLGDPEAAAHFLAGGPDRVLLVGERDLAAFGAASRRLGLSPHAFAVIRGYNYSRGRRVVLTLFDAPRSAG